MAATKRNKHAMAARPAYVGAAAPGSVRPAGVARQPAGAAAAQATAQPAGEAPVKKRWNGRGLGRIDVPLLGLVVILLAFGLVMLFSASYVYANLWSGDSYAIIRSQLQFAGVGIVVMLGATLFDYRKLRRFAWPLMIVTLVLLVVVLFMPEGTYGGHRWIWLNSSHSLSIQPSEIAKFAVILLFSALIAAHQSKIKTFKYGFLPFVLVLGLVALLLVLEPHLSCTILILGIGVAMMFAGGTAVRWFGFAALAAGGALLLVLTQFPDLIPYAGDRISAWLDPFNAPPEKGYQIIQSLIAVGSGGPTGRGIGNSRQKFLYLPEMHNDYIFAVLCEELGMVGAVALIALFLLLLARSIYVAVRCKDKFGAMLVIGISVQIALQAFLHMAVNINAIPSTGISLPFFSSGGTSLVMLMGQIGIVLSVSRRADLDRRAEQKKEEDALTQAEPPFGALPRAT